MAGIVRGHERGEGSAAKDHNLMLKIPISVRHVHINPASVSPPAAFVAGVECYPHSLQLWRWGFALSWSVVAQATLASLPQAHRR